MHEIGGPRSHGLHNQMSSFFPSLNAPSIPLFYHLLNKRHRIKLKTRTMPIPRIPVAYLPTSKPQRQVLRQRLVVRHAPDINVVERVHQRLHRLPREAILQRDKYHLSEHPVREHGLE
jgi:hypothetical protein